jgi:hypothetical protein
VTAAGPGAASRCRAIPPARLPGCQAGLSLSVYCDRDGHGAPLTREFHGQEGPADYDSDGPVPWP